MKDQTTIEIRLDKDPNTNTFLIGEEISGELVVFPREDLDVSRMGYQVILETRGKVGVYQEVISANNLVTDKVLNKFEKYKFPIQFINHTYETYKGENASFLIKIEPYTELNTTQSLASTISSIFKKKNDNAQYLNFISDTPTFQIQKQILYLDPLVRIFEPLVIGVTLCAFSFMLHVLVGAILTTTFLIIALIYVIYGKSIGDVELELTDTEEDISIALRQEKYWSSIRKIMVVYEVVEEVIDRRGTTDYTHKHIIHESEEKEFQRPANIIRTSFPYPSAGTPPTMQLKDSRIYWAFEIYIYTDLGIRYIAKSDFTVRKHINEG